MCERRGVVVRIERGLVPALAEVDAGRIVRIVAIAVAGVWVETDEMTVVDHLERAVMAHDPAALLAHERFDHGGGNLRMVVRCERIADIVQQGADDPVGIRAVPLRSRSALQRMAKAGDPVAAHAVFERAQAGQHALGRARCIGRLLELQEGVFFGRAILHPDEIDRCPFIAHDRSLECPAPAEIPLPLQLRKPAEGIRHLPAIGKP